MTPTQAAAFWTELQRALTTGRMPQAAACDSSPSHRRDAGPVVGGIAEHYQYSLLWVEAEDDEMPGVPSPGEAGSDWLLLTRNQEFLNDDVVLERSEGMKPGSYESIRPWTDQFSNLLEILEKPDWMKDSDPIPTGRSEMPD